MQELKQKEIKCKKCNVNMKRMNDMKFGSTQYKQYKCTVCNTVEYQIIGVV